MSESPVISVENVTKHFPMSGSFPWTGASAHVRAVDGVSFEIGAHEALSLVGESGCGKTTTARMVLRLEHPTSGRILHHGADIHHLDKGRLREYHSAVQAVFQDPWSSLNPRMRARDIVAEPLVVNLEMTKKQRNERVADLLRVVGLHERMADSYAHEFSGGMRQRLAMARALSLNPSLIVLDEPVSSLDVSIRAQIMNVLKDLQEEFGIAYLLIAHDLATVRYLSHRVAVMYLGVIVETALAEELFTGPRHPYTKALISAARPPRPGEETEEIVLRGEVPSATSPPPGCRFHTRCYMAQEVCKIKVPPLRDIGGGHKSACHFAEDVTPLKRVRVDKKQLSTVALARYDRMPRPSPSEPSPAED